MSSQFEKFEIKNSMYGDELFDSLLHLQEEAFQEMDDTGTDVVNQAVDPEPDLQGETEQGTHLNDEDGEDDHEEEDNSDDGMTECRMMMRPKMRTKSGTWVM